MDRFSLLASIHIELENSCIAAVCHATTQYAKPKYWSAKRQIFVAKLQILTPHHCLTLSKIFFVGTL